MDSKDHSTTRHSCNARALLLRLLLLLLLPLLVAEVTNTTVPDSNEDVGDACKDVMGRMDDS
jgi:hypothetical protein